MRRLPGASSGPQRSESLTSTIGGLNACAPLTLTAKRTPVSKSCASTSKLNGKIPWLLTTIPSSLHRRCERRSRRQSSSIDWISTKVLGHLGPSIPESALGTTSLPGATSTTPPTLFHIFTKLYPKNHIPPPSDPHTRPVHIADNLPSSSGFHFT